MINKLEKFEAIARKAHLISGATEQYRINVHPFDLRNIHPKLQSIVKSLFDDGHYAQATFEAFKIIENEVQHLSGSDESGKKMFMNVFSENNPIIKLNNLSTPTEKDEQEGYKFIFAGSALAIRNPRAHNSKLIDDPDRCLDYIGLASLLLWRLDEAGYN
jgi:uncharacterized protein (TIGR02391 family)